MSYVHWAWIPPKPAGLHITAKTAIKTQVVFNHGLIDYPVPINHQPSTTRRPVTGNLENSKELCNIFMLTRSHHHHLIFGGSPPPRKGERWVTSRFPSLGEDCLYVEKCEKNAAPIVTRRFGENGVLLRLFSNNRRVVKVGLCKVYDCQRW